MSARIAIVQGPAVALKSAATEKILFMRGGVHACAPINSADGLATIKVLADEAAATALEIQRASLRAKRGKVVEFCFADNAEPTFFPACFFWSESPTPGIYCSGEKWTARGEAELAEGRQLAPVLHVDTQHEPARIVYCEDANSVMGGIVNPSLQPVKAKSAIPLNAIASGELMFMPGGLQTITPFEGGIKQPIRVMVDASGARAMEAQRTALEARGKRAFFDFNHEDGAASFWPEEFFWSETPQPAIYCRGEWTVRGKTAVEGREFRQFSPVFHVDNKRGNPARIICREFASPNMGGLVNDAAFHGISPLWSKADATAGAENFSAEKQPHKNQMTVRNRDYPIAIEITAESPRAALQALGAIIARNAALPLKSSTAAQKAIFAHEAAAFYKRELAPRLNEWLDAPLGSLAIQAADSTDINLGLLSGTIALQQSLPLLKYEFPILSSITTDYAAEPGVFNQTAMTRIILEPAVQTYDATADSAGRPKGWVTVSPAQSVDVPITIDEYVGVPIVFGAQTLAKTLRNLFAEQAGGAIYGLGKYMVNKLAALMTAANFNAYKQITDASCGTTSGSTAITLATTAGVYPGQQISGAGIPANTYIASVTDATNAVMTQKATATATVTATLGGGKVPTLYPTYVKALADFSMASLGEIKAAFDVNEVPMRDRFALLNAQYHSRLAADPTFNTFWATMHKPDVITEGALPRLQGITPQEAPWFPSSSNRVGFAGHRTALAIKTRLPADFINATDAKAPGNVSTVIDPDTGISLLLVQYINLQAGYAEVRPEVMLGAAVGNRRCGMVITSA